MTNNSRNSNYEVSKVTSWFSAPGEVPTLGSSYLWHLFHACLSQQITEWVFWSTMFTIIFLGPGLKGILKTKQNKAKQTKKPSWPKYVFKEKYMFLKRVLQSQK